LFHRGQVRARCAILCASNISLLRSRAMTTGTLFIIAAPSGAGKTTLVGRLLAKDANILHSVSYTTRAPRPGEVDGREYHFVDESQFVAMRGRDEFVEWAAVHGNFYGTSRVWLEEHMAAGTDVVLEIDWQGAQQVRQKFPAAVGIFILPPSLPNLSGGCMDARQTVRQSLRGDWRQRWMR